MHWTWLCEASITLTNDLQHQQGSHSSCSRRLVRTVDTSNHLYACRIVSMSRWACRRWELCYVIRRRDVAAARQSRLADR